MISFIVPAHNEEESLGGCLSSIQTAMATSGAGYEVIVMDDASTDATSEIARKAGARIDRVAHRKIAAVRNAGSRAASGTKYFFLDADTQINEQVVRDALAAMEQGAVGGGCVPDLAEAVPMWGRIIHISACLAGRMMRLVGGSCLFCTSDAFVAVGGFSEELYAGEDIAFVQALKKVGRFVVIRPTVITSARKLRVVGPWELISLLFRIAIRGPRYESPWVRDILYGERAQESRKRTEVNRLPR